MVAVRPTAWLSAKGSKELWHQVRANGVVKTLEGFAHEAGSGSVQA